MNYYSEVEESLPERLPEVAFGGVERWNDLASPVANGSGFGKHVGVDVAHIDNRVR